MASLQTRILVQLRDLILKGEFAPGERLTEVGLTDKLNVSRTPIRAALVRLEKEGLIEPSPSGGYMMRKITPVEIDDAILVRGLLEGMAARLIAEHGVPRQLSLDLHECLREGDNIIDSPTLEIDGYTAYTQMNDRFHHLIVQGAGNQTIIRAMESVNALPFASASALVPSPASVEQGKRWLIIAHSQHHAIVEAMEKGQSGRAQALAEEHINISRQNLRFALEQGDSAAKFMPALKLVSRNVS